MRELESVVYTVTDIQKMLGIGKNQAYELIKKEEFHVKRIGKKIIIPKIGFHEWLEGNTLVAEEPTLYR